MARSSTGGGRGKGRDNDHDSCRPHITRRLHSNAYEALFEHESSDDEESTVGRRGPVVPTPLPEPRNHLAIKTKLLELLEKFCRPCGAIHGRVGKMSLVEMPIGCLSKYYQWESEWDDQVRTCWEKFKKRKFMDLLSRARESAKAAVNKAGDEKLGRPATMDELWMLSHGKKGTRPLDRLLRRERGEGSKEQEEINFQDNVEWVDAKAKESFVSFLLQNVYYY
ncbi:hypothetical protein R6Q59_003191 [Mikania micrantha]